MNRKHQNSSTFCDVIRVLLISNYGRWIVAASNSLRLIAIKKKLLVGAYQLLGVFFAVIMNTAKLHCWLVLIILFIMTQKETDKHKPTI